MSYLVTIRTGPAATDVQSYAAIGNLTALLDAAYATGALGVTIRVRP
jgi:hypothetical protein